MSVIRTAAQPIGAVASAWNRRIVEFGLLGKAQPVAGKQARILGRQPPRHAEQRGVESAAARRGSIGTRRRHDWHPRRLVVATAVAGGVSRTSSERCSRDVGTQMSPLARASERAK